MINVTKSMEFIERDSLPTKLWLCIVLFGIVIISITIPLLVFYRIVRKQGRANGYRSVDDDEPLVSDDNRTDSMVTATKLVCSRLTCLAAGVFLTAALLDIICDGNEAFERYLGPSSDKSLQYTCLCTIGGFLLILGVESVAESLTDESADNSELSLLRNLILVLALSLHSVFEGLSVGLLTDHLKVLSTFLAISIHKAIIAINVGLRMIPLLPIGPVNVDRRLVVQLISVFFFAVASPTGIIVGSCLINQIASSPKLDLVIGILQGISTGTFLYIVFGEMLAESLFQPGLKRKEKLIRICLLSAGVLLMSCIIML